MESHSILRDLVFKNPDILSKILEGFPTEDLKSARLISQSFNTEVCRILRKTVIIRLDNLNEKDVNNYVDLRSNSDSPFELPFIKFCNQLPLYNFKSRLQLKLESMCVPNYPITIYKSWLPDLDNDCSQFFSTLIEHSNKLRTILFGNRFYNITKQIPEFPPEVKALRLESLKIFREDCWSIERLLHFGFEDFVVNLLELAPSTIEELEFGTPSLLQRVLSCERIKLGNLKKLGLKCSNVGLPVADTLIFLSQYKALSQIVDLKLIFWHNEAEIGLNELLRQVSKTLVSLAISANFNQTVNGKFKKHNIEFPRMEKLKKLWIDDPNEFSFLTESNFPVLEKLTFWGTRFSEDDERIRCLRPLRSVMKVKLVVSEDMIDGANGFQKFLELFQNLKKLWLYVDNRLVKKDTKLMNFLEVVILESENIYSQLEEFRFVVPIHKEVEGGILWDQFVGKEETDGFISKKNFPRIKKVELKYSPERNQNYMPKSEIRRYYFN